MGGCVGCAFYFLCGALSCGVLCVECLLSPKGASALALQSGLNLDWIESGFNPIQIGLPDSIQSGLDRVRTILSHTTETDRVRNALCGY